MQPASQSESLPQSNASAPSDRSDASAPPLALPASDAPDKTALQIQPHQPHFVANRPVDPSPIQVSHTVSLAGKRPVGVSPLTQKPHLDFRNKPSILNRPVAPNTTEDGTNLMGYLD